jgi:predicted component of type VI protein secretion system
LALSPLSPHQASPAELQEQLAAERSGNGFLVVRDDGGAQRLVPLSPEAERLTIGRARSADVSVWWDDAVSRVHAEIVRVGGRWTIVDDGLSRNGTFINGTRLQGRRTLRDRDEVRVGATIVAVRLPAAAEGATTRHADDTFADVRVTEAQRRVLMALCRPYKDGDEFARPATNQQIADELFLSINAVKTHLRALFRAFGVGEDVPQNEKRLRVVETALRRGLVSLRDL